MNNLWGKSWNLSTYFGHFWRVVLSLVLLTRQEYRPVSDCKCSRGDIMFVLTSWITYRYFYVLTQWLCRSKSYQVSEGVRWWAPQARSVVKNTFLSICLEIYKIWEMKRKRNFLLIVSILFAKYFLFPFLQLHQSLDIFLFTLIFQLTHTFFWHFIELIICIWLNLRNIPEPHLFIQIMIWNDKMLW